MPGVMRDGLRNNAGEGLLTGVVIDSSVGVNVDIVLEEDGVVMDYKRDLGRVVGKDGVVYCGIGVIVGCNV